MSNQLLDKLLEVAMSLGPEVAIHALSMGFLAYIYQAYGRVKAYMQESESEERVQSSEERSESECAFAQDGSQLSGAGNRCFRTIS